MCGIVGYVGPREAADVVIDGLRWLEYRGYDSAGIAVADGGTVFISMVSGIQEVRARGARTVCLAEVGDTAIEPCADELIRRPRVPVPLQPLGSIVPLQLFACELASAMGRDVDQPRNLAKSVTVE